MNKVHVVIQSMVLVQSVIPLLYGNAYSNIIDPRWPSRLSPLAYVLTSSTDCVKFLKVKLDVGQLC